MSRGEAGGALAAVVARARSALAGPWRAVVVGDVMLDRYVDGASTRLSPEAPVPVVDVAGEHVALGGAANVAAGLAALGAGVTLVGVVGDDGDGATVWSLAEDAGLDVHLVVDAGRPTTTKERIRVDGRHVLRVDREVRSPLDAATDAAVRAATVDALRDAAVLVVSDYAKGVLAPGFVTALADRPPTIVDPKHDDVERYTGADVLAPNRREALAAAGSDGGGHAADVDAAVRALAARLAGTAIVVTCGADGMVWRAADADGADPDVHRRPSVVGTVEDVTGAGDAVVCGLVVAAAAGLPLVDGVALGFLVAAAAVEAPGTVVTDWSAVEAVAARAVAGPGTP
ncbi:MAG: hypothetical protein KDB36_12970 [Acidimicrobiales bacterium]|nr:hypothetical protein [Acidimicrobiales bacterium]